MDKNNKVSLEKEIKHIPVMLDEVIGNLRLKKGDVCVDCTLGLAGHAEAILKLIGDEGKFIGIDCDDQVLLRAKKNLKPFDKQCHFAHDNFKNFATILDSFGIKKVDRILLDLGISSFQLDDIKRGFTLREKADLDMRMNQAQEISALEVVNSYTQENLERILKDYGEENFSRRIAKAIIVQRLQSPIKTTVQLRNVVLNAYPGYAKKYKIHPATRTFQAIRIEVNQELESIKDVLSQFLKYLDVGGRIAVISFHSLEDRIVKHKFKDFLKEGQVSLITKKPLRPTDEEIKLNPRSRSARLRIAERV